MTSHKFAVGDRVVYEPGRFVGSVSAGIYTITRLLPLTREGYQYRVKNALNNEERVMDEANLRAA